MRDDFKIPVASIRTCSAPCAPSSRSNSQRSLRGGAEHWLDLLNWARVRTRDQAPASQSSAVDWSKLAASASFQKRRPGQPSRGSWASRGSGAWYVLLGNTGHSSCPSTSGRIGGGLGPGAGHCVWHGDRCRRALLVFRWPADPGAIDPTRSLPMAVVVRGSCGGLGACLFMYP